MSGHARVRCCRANDLTQRARHLCFDLLTPFTGEVLAALAAVRCPCGGTTIVLTPVAPEPWEPGGYDPAWEAVSEECKAADEAENALPEGDAPDPDLPADAPEALREERALRIAAERGWDQARDTLLALAGMVKEGARKEARAFALGVLGEESDEPVVSHGVSAPDGRESGIAMTVSTHWAVHAMAASIGRSLGKAVNYMEMRFDDFAAPGGVRTYIVSIQRPEGQTPHALRVQAERERDSIARAVVAEREARETLAATPRNTDAYDRAHGERRAAAARLDALLAAVAQKETP